MAALVLPTWTLFSGFQGISRRAFEVDELSNSASGPARYTDSVLTFYSVAIQYRRVVLSTQGSAIHTIERLAVFQLAVPG